MEKEEIIEKTLETDERQPLLSNKGKKDISLNIQDNEQNLLKKKALEIVAALTSFETEFFTAGQMGKIIANIIANSATYLTLSQAKPMTNPLPGIAASVMGGLINTVSDKAIGYSVPLGLKRNFQDAINLIHSACVSEGVRGLEALIAKGNVSIGYAWSIILPSLVQSLMHKELSKGQLAQEKVVELKKLVKDYLDIAKTNPAFTQLSEQAQQKDTHKEDTNNEGLVLEVERRDHTDDDLIKVEKRLTALFNTWGKLHIENRNAESGIGYIANAGMFLALSFAPAEVALFAPMIASAFGSLVHAGMLQATETDRGPKLKTAFRFFDGIAVSGGAYATVDLLSQLNADIGFIAKVALPALIQTTWFADMAKGSTAQADFVELKQLMVQHAEIAKSLGKESPFSEQNQAEFYSMNKLA